MKDLPADTRAQIEQDLKGQDPALVRLILNNMRLMRQMGQYAPSQGVMQASGEVANPLAAKAAGTASGENLASPAISPRTHVSAGLGTIQPWSNPSSTAGGPVQQPPYTQPLDAFGNPYSAQSGSPFGTIQPAAHVDHHSYSPNSAAGAAGPVGQYAAPNGLNQVPQGFLPQPGTFAPDGTPMGVPIGGQVSTANVPVNAVAGGPPQPGVNSPTGALGPNMQLAFAATNAMAPAANAPLPMNPQFSAMSGQPTAVAAKFKEDLDRLIASTEAALAQAPPGSSPAERQAYVQRQVYLRMLYLMAGQQQRALEAIRDIDSADQEFWQQVFWAMSNYFDGEVMPDASDRAAQTVSQLRSAVLRLQEKARLELRNVNFCHKISSFGNYERFGRDEFSPNQDVLVYAEVNNFKSEPTADGQYRTLLRSTIEIFQASPNGELVATMPFEPTPDLCSSHRRDYFHSYVVTIPANISLGQYMLKLRVADELSGKTAEYMLKFVVK